MGIFSRFTDIINSNINSILDKAEDPEKMVRLIIQEMEDTLVEVRSTSAKTLAEKKDITRQVSRLNADVETWQGKAELALSKGRDDLARAALMEKNKSEDAATAMQSELDQYDLHIAKLQDEISQLQDKLADAKARQKAIIIRGKTVSTRLKVKNTLGNSKMDDALSRFDRYERKIDDLESQVDAFDLGKKSLSDEIEELASDDSINNELEALKAKMQQDKASKATAKDTDEK